VSRLNSRVTLIAAVFAYLLLAGASAARKSPWEDEGFINSVAYNLRVAGRMASPTLEPAGLGYIVWPEVDKYTYYHMPVYFLVQSVWGRVADLGPLGVRSLSIFAGLLSLLAWAVTFRALLDPGKALLARFMLATDYIFVLNASTAREEMLSAAFAALAYASYLTLRTRTLEWALLVANGFIVASGLTHPLGGFVSLCVLVYLVATLDGPHLRARHVAVSGLPYLVGGTLWLSYILRAPSVFLAQFSSTMVDGHRMSMFRAPWSALAGEATRYGALAGLSSLHALARLRGLIVLAFAVSLIANLVSRRLRSERGHVALLVLIAVTSLVLAVFDGRKESLYLVHTIPFLVGITAATGCALWRMRVLPRWVIGGALLGYVLLNAGGSMYLILRNDYATIYKPAADLIQLHAGPQTSLIFAPAEMGLALHFPSNMRIDAFLGYSTRRVADWIVISSNQRGFIDSLRTKNPEAFRYVTDLLATRYRRVFQNRDYEIYQLISAG